MSALGSWHTGFQVDCRTVLITNGTGIQVDCRFESAIRYHGNLGIITHPLKLDIDKMTSFRIIALYWTSSSGSSSGSPTNLENVWLASNWNCDPFKGLVPTSAKFLSDFTHMKLIILFITSANSCGINFDSWIWKVPIWVDAPYW